jgi:hypothetical protein
VFEIGEERGYLGCCIVEIEDVLEPECIRASGFEEWWFDGAARFDFIYWTERDEFSAEKE